MSAPSPPHCLQLRWWLPPRRQASHWLLAGAPTGRTPLALTCASTHSTRYVRTFRAGLAAGHALSRGAPVAWHHADMTWKRAERVVWLLSGVALALAFVLFLQNRHDRLSMLFIVFSLGGSLLFELVRRLARGGNRDLREDGTQAGRTPQ